MWLLWLVGNSAGITVTVSSPSGQMERLCVHICSLCSGRWVFRVAPEPEGMRRSCSASGPTAEPALRSTHRLSGEAAPPNHSSGRKVCSVIRRSQAGLDLRRNQSKGPCSTAASLLTWATEGSAATDVAPRASL